MKARSWRDIRRASSFEDDADNHNLYVMELVGNAWQSFMDAPGYSEYSPWFPNPLICLRDIARTGVNEAGDRPLLGN